MKKRFIILLITAFFYMHLLQAQILNNNFEKIDIYYTDFNIMSVINLPCDDFLSYSREHKTITDSLDIEIWIGILIRLNKADTENKYFDRILDTRGKLFLYSCKDTIQICLDYRYTDINNERFDTSSELRLELEKMFHKPKPKKQKENNRK